MDAGKELSVDPGKGVGMPLPHLSVFDKKLEKFLSYFGPWDAPTFWKIWIQHIGNDMFLEIHYFVYFYLGFVISLQKNIVKC